MNTTEPSDKLLILLKETADGLVRLIADHFKLARLELFADMKSLGRHVLILAVVAFFVFLGYAFGCLGLAVVTSRWLGFSGALFLLGGLHLVGGVTALLIVARRLHRMHLLNETASAARQSVSTLTTSIVNGAAPTATTPESAVLGVQATTTKFEGGSRIAKTLL